ncbi:MAG: hypothetical protein ITG00_02070 [Flavobacterium sp.]|nr:hypothetical protein [Flavobacterium sp.]
MKNFILLFALLIASQGYSKGFPSPSVLFSISEKIINEAHQLVFSSDKEKLKKKPEVKIKTKVEKTDSATEQFWNPVEIRRDGMWIVAE